ncbi:MAG: ornithine--oxo-acid transaminase [Chloroflexi bacterium GWB2_49_20]|nr:MAG: ornithine--oxo-acid transaminase [Chloroflexi bacterium GWB2_49_20]OGN80018.1 MAG: ornithine--oxo-acid transaminase [Chloroflexi bacterium GWC2_49_37]OGN85446.1 MAG: ornithine--oxo-acid transaminase [Chloroflexi bacterium GWD2_49_16]HBG74310.1 ornithine--oxo-acid transaminase [Anaerolineae bacterium]HCM97080.1 ornithine--oxo-acid transaminase [Anaerolineae bacterium]
MNANEYIRLEEQYGANNYHPLDVVLARGDGVWVYDIDGNKYLDCLSAYSAVNQGHVHPKILSALQEQAKKITLTSRAFRNDQLPLLYKELADLTGYDMSLPMNSGAEAVETALKLARKWAYQVKGVPRHKAEIITCEGNFHGRTISTISFSSEPLYRDDFGPFTPGFISAPFGNADAIADLINSNTAAVLLEPIQGEAGVVVPPKGFLSKVSEICKKNNVLLIADEIQTGLGRTGKLFACQHEDVHPDITILGKALSGGFYPISAIVADKALLGLFTPGEHGSTFGGNPLAAAVARAAIKVLVEENMVQNSALLGEYFIDQLSDISSPHIKEIRGKGLFIGVVLRPSAGGARRFCEALQQQGILAKETHEHVIRFAPPLVIDKETIDWALPRIREVLTRP